MLKNRLLKICSYVNKNSKVLDIGTDHGYVPIYLLKNKIAKYVILADLNEKPLNNAKNNLKNSEVIDNYELRKGDALNVIKNNEHIDFIIIAGMGGLLIRDMINFYSYDVSNYTFILQPNDNEKDLREYLIKNNFEFYNENIAIENKKYYEMFVVKKSKIKSNYTMEDALIGNLSLHNDTVSLIKYIIYMINKNNSIIKRIKTNSVNTTRILELQDNNMKYEQMLNNIHKIK